MEAQYMQNSQLDGDTFFLEAGQAGVLLFHGFTATTAEVRLLAEQLYQYGYTISAPLLPGHGTHPKQLNQTHRTAWMRAAEDAYLDLAADHSPVWVGGESLGALVALYLASLYADIQGVLLYAPALRVRRMAFSRVVAPFVPYLKKHAGNDQLPWKGYTVYPVRAAKEMYRFQKDILSCLPHIHQPILVIQGRLDHTIDPNSGSLILAKSCSAYQEHHWLENSTHCLLLDRELDKATDLTLNFLVRTAAQPA